MSNKTPKIRFRFFNKGWEERDFTKIVKRVPDKSSSKILPRVEFEDIISNEGRLNKDITNKYDIRKGVHFHPEYILYGKLRPYLNNWLFPTFEGIALGDFWVFKTIYGIPLFNYYLIQSDRYQKVANLSSGTKMPRSDWGTVSSTKFFIPGTMEEQSKIGEFFKYMDELIELHHHALHLLKQRKKAFLQKMFPKKGESIPEIRFMNHISEWKQYKFFEVIDRTIDFRGRTPKKLGYNWSNEGYLALSALNVKNGYIDYSVDAHYGNEELYHKWMNGNELRKNQVLFTTEAPMGNVAQVPDNKGYILSQRTLAFEVNKKKVTDDFLAVLLKTTRVYRDLLSLSSGGTAKGVSQKSLSFLKIMLPNDIDEQEKIGNFFKELDNSITLQEEKIESLKQMKKAFLQKMFV